jgi:hypothetical protein
MLKGVGVSTSPGAFERRACPSAQDKQPEAITLVIEQMETMAPRYADGRAARRAM